MTPPTGSVSLSRAKVANSDPISSISSSVGTWMPRLVEGRRVDVVVVVVVCDSKRLLAEPTKEEHVDDGPFANAKKLQPNRNDSIVWKCCKCCTSHGPFPSPRSALLPYLRTQLKAHIAQTKQKDYPPIGVISTEQGQVNIKVFTVYNRTASACWSPHRSKLTAVKTMCAEACCRCQEWFLFGTCQVYKRSHHLGGFQPGC